MKRKIPELYETGGLDVSRYDLETPGAFKGDIPFYLKEAEKAKGPILELASGTGRVSLPLAEAGFDVVGLEISPHMLRAARTKASAGRIRFVRGDMRRFSIRRKFKLVLIPFRAFHHLLTVKDQKSCLTCIRRHLSPGGRLIINLFDPRLDWCLPGLNKGPASITKTTHQDPKTGGRIEIQISPRINDAFHQTTQGETWTFRLKNRRGRVLKTERRTLTLRWTYRWEMQHLLELSGFKVLACYSDFKKGPAKYGAEQVWVAEKS